MGMNSHNHTINESAKKFSSNVTHEKYEIAVGLRCAECLKLFRGVRGAGRDYCKCAKSK